MSQRTILIAYLLTSILSACAASGSAEPLLNGTTDAEDAAQVMLSDVLTLNSAVSSAYVQVKDDLKPNQFSFFDQIQRSLQQADASPHLFDRAAAEILKQMQMTDQELLAAKVYALVSRFAELTSVPRESIPAQRLADYLDDSIDLSTQIEVFLVGDRDDQKKDAYYFSPAYNLVETTHIVALAAAGYGRPAIEITYHEAIETNQHLLGSGDAGDDGYLSEWVASNTAGSTSASEKLDNDPILYCIRRFLEGQQAALE